MTATETGRCPHARSYPLGEAAELDFDPGYPSCAGTSR